MERYMMELVVEQRPLTALHEAAHAVVGLALGYEISYVDLAIQPDGSIGFTKVISPHVQSMNARDRAAALTTRSAGSDDPGSIERPEPTNADLRLDIVFSLAGPVADEIGRATANPAAAVLVRAEQTIREIVGARRATMKLRVDAYDDLNSAIRCAIASHRELNVSDMEGAHGPVQGVGSAENPEVLAILDRGLGRPSRCSGSGGWS